MGVDTFELVEQMKRELWEWLDGPGRPNQALDPLHYARSFDRAIALEQLAALYRIEAAILKLKKEEQ